MGLRLQSVTLIFNTHTKFENNRVQHFDASIILITWVHKPKFIIILFCIPSIAMSAMLQDGGLSMPIHIIVKLAYMNSEYLKNYKYNKNILAGFFHEYNIFLQYINFKLFGWKELRFYVNQVGPCLSSWSHVKSSL